MGVLSYPAIVACTVIVIISDLELILLLPIIVLYFMLCFYFPLQSSSCAEILLNKLCMYVERHTYHDCQPVHSTAAVTETTHPADDDGVDGYEEPHVTPGTATTFPRISTTIGNAIL